jgi:hypothetical protein
MSPTPAKANTHPDPSVPKQQAAAHYATVSEQADELKVQIAQARTNIKVARRNIEENEDFILRAEEERAKLLRRKRIFARAKFDLEQVDAE